MPVALKNEKAGWRFGLQPALSLLLVLLAYGCRDHSPPAGMRWLTMSTEAGVSVPASAAAALPEISAETAAVFSEIEGGFSVFRDSSDLAAINRQAGVSAVRVNSRLLEVLDYALRVARESGGAFDPTVGPLMRCWGFRTNTVAALPAPEDLAAARALVGWNRVEKQQDAEGHTWIRLGLPGMRLDLGAIAKGYAVDAAYERLLPRHDDFMVDLGGNLRFRGEAAAGRGGWRAGIRNPFDRNTLIGSVLMTNGEALATSGNYERFVILNSKKFSHIMDPRTGSPVEGMAGVTVLASSAMEADALSTALFVLGPTAGANLLRLHPGCEALWVPDSEPRRLIATPGMARRLELGAAWRGVLVVRTMKPD